MNHVCEDNTHCTDQNQAFVCLLLIIDNVIKKMRRGKDSCFDGPTSDYLINGTDTRLYYISLMFSCMCIHCCRLSY